VAGTAGLNIGAVEELDRLLEKGDQETQRAAVRRVVTMVERGDLKRFGNEQLLPKREYTAYELKMFRVDLENVLYPEDKTTKVMARNILLATTMAYVALPNTDNLLGLVLGAFFLIADQIVAAGGGFALVVDAVTNIVNDEYRKRVSIHEAGHLLIAYLLGILPQGYRLSSVEFFKSDGMMNVQAGTAMLDPENIDRRRVVGLQQGQDSPDAEDEIERIGKYAAIAVGGVAAEYVVYDHAEGGEVDMVQLDRLLSSAKLKKREATIVKTWAALASVSVLREKKELLLELASAMRDRASIGNCIQIIERWTGSNNC